MKYFTTASLAVLLAWVSVSSCKKTPQEIPERVPPNPVLQWEKLIVGSGVDTISLNSAGNMLSPDIDFNFASDWQSRWDCIEKPSGAPDPTIYGDNAMSARAVGLVAGDYKFQITYSTKTLSKKNVMEVTVVPEKPAGTVVILDNLTWSVSPPGDFAPISIATASRQYAPDLFYFRGRRMEPIVEYLDPKTNVWVKTMDNRDLQLDISQGLLRFNDRDYVFFDYTKGSMLIWLERNIPEDWLSGAVNNPPVRLTY
jgi:hypothetical protein